MKNRKTMPRSDDSYAYMILLRWQLLPCCLQQTHPSIEKYLSISVSDPFPWCKQAYYNGEMDLYSTWGHGRFNDVMKEASSL